MRLESMFIIIRDNLLCIYFIYQMCRARTEYKLCVFTLPFGLPCFSFILNFFFCSLLLIKVVRRTESVISDSVYLCIKSGPAEIFSDSSKLQQRVCVCVKAMRRIQFCMDEITACTRCVRRVYSVIMISPVYYKAK